MLPVSHNENTAYDKNLNSTSTIDGLFLIMMCNDLRSQKLKIFCPGTTEPEYRVVTISTGTSPI